VTADKTAADRFAQAMHQCPLLGVLRGVPAEQAEAMANVLVEAGFAMIEIPLDAPHATESIERIAARHGNHVLVGAGRVLSVADVDAARSAGATLIAAPNVDPAVIAYAVDTGMVMLPGYFTITEAFAALDAGAHGLMLFPGQAASPAVITAQHTAIPRHVPILVRGGVTKENLSDWMAAGAAGGALGNALYKAGRSASDVAAAAKAFTREVHRLIDRTGDARSGTVLDNRFHGHVG